MTGATWVAAGTERLEVVPGLVKGDDEEEGPPRGGSPLLASGVPEGGRLAPLEPARTSPGEGTPQRVSEWTTTI